MCRSNNLTNWNARVERGLKSKLQHHPCLIPAFYYLLVNIKYQSVDISKNKSESNIGYMTVDKCPFHFNKDI